MLMGCRDLHRQGHGGHARVHVYIERCFRPWKGGSGEFLVGLNRAAGVETIGLRMFVRMLCVFYLLEKMVYSVLC